MSNDILITNLRKKLSGLYDIINQNQNRLFLDTGSVLVLQDNLRALSFRLKTPISLPAKIAQYQELARQVILTLDPLSFTVAVFTNVGAVNFRQGVIARNHLNTRNIDFSYSLTDLCLNVLGQYSIRYSVPGTDISARRIVNVVDEIAPTYRLKGANPLIWPIAVSYEDPGIDFSDNYFPKRDLSFSVTTNINVDLVGIYYYNYILSDPCYNITDASSRVVYVLNNTISRYVPHVNINSDSEHNFVNTLIHTEGTRLIPNNALLASNNYVIRIDPSENGEQGISRKFNLPLTHFTTYESSSNYLLVVYGLSDETVSVVERDPIYDISYEFPYITKYVDPSNIKTLGVNKLVNVVSQDKYKIIVVNGKYDYLAEYFDPSLTLLGQNPVNISLGIPYVEPGFTAFDFKGNNISSLVAVEGLELIDRTIPKSNEVFYIAIDMSGFQSIKMRQIVYV